MPIVKIHKARKTHICTECGGFIEPGTKYKRTSTRYGEFNDPLNPDNQTGIIYLKWKMCENCQEKEQPERWLAQEELARFQKKHDL